MRELIEARVEDGILKEIMITNGHPLPAKQFPRSCLATVSVVGAGRDQRLQVDMSDFPDPRYHPYYGFARYPTPSVSESTLDIDQLSISSHKTSRKGCSHDRKSARPSCRPQPHEPHPYGLDSTQAGIEFVLRYAFLMPYFYSNTDLVAVSRNHACAISAVTIPMARQATR